MTEPNFDPIRPYYQDEIPDAIHRIINHPQFNQLLNYLFPATEHDKMKTKLSAARTTHEFQLGFMRPVIKSILEKTAGDLSLSGMENLSRDKGYVFVSNHRDIILDSSILALHLVNNGFESCKITWGDNLMISPFVVDIGKANRMITVFREGSPKEILNNSILLSAYIRKSVVEKGQTVWIAQRKGRSKDGNDTTDASVLKMLSLSRELPLIESLKQLNIAPVSISYEWEPCDGMKVRELCYSEQHEYVKEKDEDLNSIIGGVVSNKGRIHLNIGEPLNEYLDTLDPNQRTKEVLEEIAAEIDRRIQTGYKPWPSNFIAYELLENGKINHAKYSTEAIEKFHRRMQRAIELTGRDDEKAGLYFKKLYANPVYNQLKSKPV